MFVPKKISFNKKFWSENVWPKKNQKKKFGSKKCLLKTLWVKKNVGQ